MFRTIFYWPAASSDFTFSRSALLSSPNTIRPSSASTATPSTTRSVIFSATVYPPKLEHSWKFERLAPHRQACRRGKRHQQLIIVRTGQVIAAHLAHQLAPLRLQALRTHRAETDGMLCALPLLARV